MRLHRGKGDAIATVFLSDALFAGIPVYLASTCTFLVPPRCISPKFIAFPTGDSSDFFCSNPDSDCSCGQFAALGPLAQISGQWAMPVR